MDPAPFITQPVAPTAPSALLHEKEVRLFLCEAPHHVRRASRKQLMRGAMLLSFVSVAVYALLFGDALWYSLNTPTASSSQITIPPVPVTTTEPTTPTPTPAPYLPENTLYYPDVNISVPLVWDIGLDPAESKEALTKGAMHIAGTAKPGQQGMVALSCHSSGYIWDSNPYKTACATLNKAQPGQNIALNYQNRMYTYTVSRIYEVKPSDLDILNDNRASGLRLITCTPIGTNLRRLVVEAVQADPSPENNTAFQPATFTGQLPKDR